MKKIQDIVQIRKGSTSSPAQVSVGGQKSDRAGRKSKKKPRTAFSVLWKSAMLVLILLAGIASLAFWSSLKLFGKITKEPMAFEEKVTVSFSADSVDFENMSIAGEFFEQTGEKWDVFKPTGSDSQEGMAGGAITIYNKQIPATPVTLRAQTRFLSAKDGKIFKIKEAVTIPAASGSGGDAAPGQIEVEVIAGAPGADYNIEPSNFSVPGLSGTDLYYSIWAESEKAMEGGFEKEVNKVTKEDITNAGEVLQQKIREIAAESLRKEILSDYVINNEAIFEEEFDFSCFEEPGAIVEDFNCEGSSTIKWLGFKNDDINEIAFAFIASKIDSSKAVAEDSLSLEFSPKTVLVEDEKMIVNLKVNVDIYTSIDENIFLSKISGKSKAEIEAIVFEEYPQIGDLELKFWPFWVRKAPGGSENIKLELTF